MVKGRKVRSKRERGKGKEMDRTAGRKEEKKEGSMEKGRQEGTIQEKGKNTGMKAG